MAQDFFKFKKFSVRQCDGLMKVGTDGVLLGASVSCPNAERILDIGTGTGLIALMIAQKHNAQIDAVDINIDTIKLARSNFENSDWSNRLSAICCSIQDFNPVYKYDFIVSNPPYFNTGNAAPVVGRAIARHDLELNLYDLLTSIKRLLTENGTAAIIYPALQHGEFELECSKADLFVIKRLFISPKKGYEPNRIIFEIGNMASETEDKYLSIEKDERHDYTNEYRQLTADWYLKF